MANDMQLYQSYGQGPTAVDRRRVPGKDARVPLPVLLLLSVLFVFGPGVSTPGLAASLDEIYAVDVVVAGQSREDRLRAFADGLRRVLVRATGDRSVLGRPGIVRAISHARDFVQRYDYVAVPPASPDGRPDRAPAATPSIEGPSGERLHIVYDDEAIERLLDGLGLPLWGSLRPTLIVLFAFDDGGRRRLLAAEGGTENAELTALVAEIARRRALPVILPLLDIEDQQLMRFSDVWGDFAGPLRQVAERYRAEALLVGRAYREQTGWRMRWSLHGDDGTERWEGTVARLDNGLREAVETAVDHLARHHARVVTHQSRSRTRVRIHDVRAIADFARTMDYLESLEIVDGVRLVSISGEVVECLLDVRGGRSLFGKVVAYGDTLVPVALDDAARTPTDGVDDVLNLRLLP